MCWRSPRRRAHGSITLAAILFCLAAGAACRGSREDAAVAAQLHEELAQSEDRWPRPAVQKSARDLYELRDYAPLWVQERDGKYAAAAALAMLQSAPDHGLRARDYGAETLARIIESESIWDDDAERPKRLADLDLRLTEAVLALAHDVAIGRTSPAEIDRRWKQRRRAPDLALTLARAVDARSLNAWLDEIRPRHPEYASLQQALAAARAAGHADPTFVERIALNLERWRWMPDDLGTRHLLVNIPQFHLFAREYGTTVMDIRVVVGKPEQKTPVFSSQMKTVVFSPYWHIPDDIVQHETAPAVARDPGYLARNRIEVLRTSGQETVRVDPSEVSWDDGDEVRGLAFRQKPGPHNAMGHVKFLFPNPFDVYLHDTPADSLFARSGRAFSHGCIRVEEPEALASYILRGYEEWDSARIRKAMLAGVESAVTLREPILVHIVYFTVWVDDRGQVHQLDDVYGFDARQRINLD